ncbi:MAG: hypothetical protein LBF34_03765, partial [Puniceicoccales bacterium]|nr:hypothetical protein [Puniceicoccales bacterium]
EKGDIDLDERKVMRGLYFEKETKSGDEKYVQPKKSNRARLVPQDKKVTQPSEQPQISLPPPPQELSKPEGIKVICNARVLEVYRSREHNTGLWMDALNLKANIAATHNWWESKGVRNLVYHLAEMYAKTNDQPTKDAIALYFVVTSSSYAGELAGGDDDDAEQEAIDFVNECLIDEE